jgi:cell fate (sporulation/competence/biofilm development) regulator YlbF (YheA/YmcA/DUF963 family)
LQDELQDEQYQDMIRDLEQIRDLEYDLEEENHTEMDIDQYAPCQEDIVQKQRQPSSDNTGNDHRVQLLDAHLDELQPITTNIAAKRHQRLNPIYCQHLRHLGIADPKKAHPSVIQNHLIDILCEQKLSSEDLVLARQLLRDNNKDIMAVYVPVHACLENYAKTRDDLCSVVPETNDELLRSVTPKINGISL